MMTAKKRSQNSTSNYLISMKKDDVDRKSPNFIGKVRSNFLGTKFSIYDHGENPANCKDETRTWKEIGVVLYE